MAGSRSGPPRMEKIMSTAYRLTSKRITAARQYVEEHMTHSRNGNPTIPYQYDTPDDVYQTLTRIYGSPRTLDRGETAYWMIDDDGQELGLEVAHRGTP